MAFRWYKRGSLEDLNPFSVEKGITSPLPQEERRTIAFLLKRKNGKFYLTICSQHQEQTYFLTATVTECCWFLALAIFKVFNAFCLCFFLFFFHRQEFKVLLLCFAILVAATTAAKVCKCTDEKVTEINK